MSRYINDDPFAPWNNPLYKDDPFRPWNSPLHKNDPFAPWNNPLADESDIRRYEEESGVCIDY
jgi:hypothetical protein